MSINKPIWKGTVANKEIRLTKQGNVLIMEKRPVHLGENWRTIDPSDPLWIQFIQTLVKAADRV